MSQNIEHRLDDTALKEIASLMGREKFISLVRVFRQSSEENIEKMRVLARRENPDEVKPVVHSLKGSSANIGATRLAELCLETENLLAVTPCDFSQVYQSIDRIDTELATVVPMLLDYSDDAR